MKLPLYQLDVFTNRVFGGNPAAVVVMDHWLDDAVLQSIAAENNLSETAFVVPDSECSGLRWFTPTVEMDLCGHATLAAAKVLFTKYFPNCERLRFDSNSGRLDVTRESGKIYLNFPARPGQPVNVSSTLIESLGSPPFEAFNARDLMVVFESEADVRNFVPDYQTIEALDTFALIVTAPGTDIDFVSRFFAPGAGVPEDPVTGSAHCTLIPYWARRLGKMKLTARQLSGRIGELSCELNGDRVLIGGTAVHYLSGELSISKSK